MNRMKLCVLGGIFSAGIAVLASCAPSGEIAEDEPEARAVEPRPDDDESSSSEQPPVAETAETTEQFPVDDEARGASTLRDTGDFRGQAYQGCASGTSSGFETANGELRIRSCCQDGECVNHVRFPGEETGLSVSAARIDPAGVGTNLDRLVISGRADTHSDSELAIVSVDTLRRLAEPLGEESNHDATSEILEEAQWSLDPGEIHRLEGLSARAVEEARGDCERGAHLPTLVEMSTDNEPLSESLQIRFERWLNGDTVLLSSESASGSTTAISIGIDDGCMIRKSADQFEPMRAHVVAPARRRWAPTDAFRVRTGEDQTFGVIRGVLFSETSGDDAVEQTEQLRAALRGDGNRQVIETDRMVRRMVGDGELLLWSQSDMSIEQLLDSRLEVPPRIGGDGWRIPVTVVIEDPGEDVMIEWRLED